MKNEIRSATGFLSNLLRCRNVAEDRIESFRTTLQDLLCAHYQNHWFPEKPFKGSGYRCIRINHKMDPLVKQAAAECGMSDADVHNFLPSELTMWVDPREVSYRFGENGSIGMLYESDLPHVISQKHKEKQSQLQQQQQQQEVMNVPQHQGQSSPGMPSQADLEFNTLGYTCKDQLMSVLPNVSRDSLKQLAAFV